MGDASFSSPSGLLLSGRCLRTGHGPSVEAGIGRGRFKRFSFSPPLSLFPFSLGSVFSFSSPEGERARAEGREVGAFFFPPPSLLVVFFSFPFAGRANAARSNLARLLSLFLLPLSPFFFFPFSPYKTIFFPFFPLFCKLRTLPRWLTSPELKPRLTYGVSANKDSFFLPSLFSPLFLFDFFSLLLSQPDGVREQFEAKERERSRALCPPSFLPFSFFDNFFPPFPSLLFKANGVTLLHSVVGGSQQSLGPPPFFPSPPFFFFFLGRFFLLFPPLQVLVSGGIIRGQETRCR